MDPPGGMRGGPGEVRRGKPFRVPCKGSKPGILKIRNWGLEFWDLAKPKKNLEPYPARRAPLKGAADPIASRIPPGQGRGDSNKT